MSVRIVAAFAFLVLGPALAAERGVVVEEVAAGSVLEKAGVLPGDVFDAWERMPNPPANPRGTRGAFVSPFDWLWLEIEQAPRGPVRLTGERAQNPIVIRIDPGSWNAQIRPAMSPELLEIYLRGRALAAEGDLESGTALWSRLASEARTLDDDTLARWALFRAGKAWADVREWKKARQMFETAPVTARDPVHQVAVWEGTGRAWQSENDHERARQAYRSAVDAIKEHWGESLLLGRFNNLLGGLAWWQGDLASAKEHFRRNHELCSRLAPGSLGEAAALNNLGSVAWARGNIPEAAEYYEESLVIRAELAPGSLDEAVSLGNLANVAWAQGLLDLAMSYQERALQIRHDLSPDSLDEALSLNNLGAYALARGELELADEYYKRALRIREKLATGSLDVAVSLDGLGLTAGARGDLDLASDYQQRALDTRSIVAPNSLEVAFSLNGLGLIALARNELGSAQEYFESSLELRRELAYESVEHAYTLANLGEIALKLGEVGRAVMHHERALEIYRKLAPDSLHVGRSLKQLGDIATSSGRVEEAAELYRQSLTIAERLAPHGILMAEIYKALGDLSRLTESPDQAARYFDDALRTLEAQIGKLGGSQDAKAGYRARYSYYYRDQLDLLLNLERREEAFHLLERSRARSFLAILAGRDLAFSIDEPSEIETERRQIAVLYDRTQQQVFELEPEAGSEELEALLAELRRLRARYVEVAEELRRSSPKLAALQYPEPFDVDGARHALDRGTLLLSYSVDDEKTHLFALTDEGQLRAERLPIGEEELRGRIAAFRDLIPQARPGTRHGARRLAALDLSARELHRTLLAPVADQIERVERLLILPDGPLHLLPWSALVRPDGKYLVEWKPHHVALSATVYAELRRERPREKPTDAPLLTAFGDPVYPPRFADSGESIPDARVRAVAERGFGFEPLPGTRREVERIAALYNEDAAVYLGADATEERAKSAGTRYLHFATHGLLDERFPLNSGLALTIPDEFVEGGDNGLLQAWEIFESVRLDADLVVLSACESALGQEVGGEGLVGLTRAFQYAGARSVLASLWQVADESTAILMERFYHHLRAGKTKDEALRAAQLELVRGAAPAPHAWAAFQLHGDWR